MYVSFEFWFLNPPKWVLHTCIIGFLFSISWPKIVFHFLFHIRKEYRWYLIIDNEPNFFVSCRALLLNFVIFFQKLKISQQIKKTDIEKQLSPKKKLMINGTICQWHMCVCVCWPIHKIFHNPITLHAYMTYMCFIIHFCLYTNRKMNKFFNQSIFIIEKNSLTENFKCEKGNNLS